MAERAAGAETERKPTLDVAGPMTVKEAERLVFHAARSHPQFEAAQRTWMEEDRSYFVRWKPDTTDRQLMVIALVHIYALPEMASRVTLLPFDQAAEPQIQAALEQYVQILSAELESEGFA